MNEREEGKFLGEENRKRMTELARKSLSGNGDIYLAQFGEKQLDDDVLQLKADLLAWNQLAPSTIRYNLDTINVMLQVLSTLPIKIGRMDILTDPKYAQFGMRLSAIRNRMLKERDEIIAKSNPDLSTP